MLAAILALVAELGGMLRPVAALALMMSTLSLVFAIPALAIAGFRVLRAKTEAERTAALAILKQQMVDVGERLGRQLNAVVIQNPQAAALIAATKETLVKHAEKEFAETLAKIGGTRAGLETVIIAGAQATIAGMLAERNAADPGVPSVDLKAAEKALAIASDVVPLIAPPEVAR